MNNSSRLRSSRVSSSGNEIQTGKSHELRRMYSQLKVGFNPKVKRHPTPDNVFSTKFISTKTNYGFRDDENLVGDNLLVNFKAFLLFGKFIGLIPIQGLHQDDPNELKFKFESFPSLLSLCIAFGLFVNAIIGLIYMLTKTTNAEEFAWNPHMFVFYSNGCFLYLFFLTKSERLIRIMQEWSRMKLRFTQSDLQLSRDTNFIAGFIMTSAILENAVGHLKLFPFVKNSGGGLLATQMENENYTALGIYYIRSHDQWANLFSYHPLLAIFVFVCNKLTFYTWNYMDILIPVMARALYFKFKALYLQAETLIRTSGKNTSQFDRDNWRQLTKDHEFLVDTLMEIGDFLSPLIFVSYGLNVYYICLQLNVGLTASNYNSTVATVYNVWSFLHLIVRFLVISIAGARCNEWAHRVRDLFQDCPKELYILEVARTERFLSVNVIGLTGLDCFVITRSLIVQVAGVVFTFEIFLLQARQSPTTVSPKLSSKS